MPSKFFTPKLVRLISVVAVCLLLIFLNPKGVFDPVRIIFLRIAHPFQKTFFILGGKTRNIVGFLVSISDLKNENEKLIKENNGLSSQVMQLLEEKKENETLREQLKLAPKERYDLESAFIIGQDPRGGESWMIIDKGLADGVKAGMPVIVSEGIIVGKISESYPTTAKFILLSDSASSVNAVDLETGAKGIIRGEYGLGLKLDMVEQTSVLNVGDNIVTSGLGGSVPKGLLVGKIQEINSTQDKLFQQAIVIGRIKYFKLDVVHVIKNTIP